MSTRRLPHIDLTIGGVSSAVLVCGEPARATHIASYLDKAEMIGDRREYRSYQGTYKGQPVTVCSHGVGAPGAAIAFEELITAGGQTFIRVGTCGGVFREVMAGHLVVATAAVQQTGYGYQLLPEGYPAVADLDLTLALRELAAPEKRPCHTGIVLTRDAFYPGVLPTGYETLAEANVLAVEMECAALFMVGSLRGVKTAAILAVDGNVLETGDSMETFEPRQDVVRQATDAAIQIALKAVVY